MSRIDTFSLIILFASKTFMLDSNFPLKYWSIANALNVDILPIRVSRNLRGFDTFIPY